MRKKTWVALLLAVPLFAAGSHGRGDHKPFAFSPQINFGDNDKICFRHGSVFIVDRNHDEDVVEITNDHRLIVNDRVVQTSDEQQELVDTFHDLAAEIYSDAMKIGFEGARVGLEGAELGLKAVMKVCMLVLPGYSSEDLERDMETEKAKVEAKAKKLESHAKRIEARVDELETLQFKLKEAIPELEDLDWF